MDRKSAVVLGVIFGGLFLSLFGFLFLAYLAVNADEESSSSFSSAPQVGVIEVKGEIKNTEKLLKNLTKFAKNDKIKAILVRIDSPGGAVAPSQELYTELRRIGEKKKVVCSMGNLAASGGYYIAVGCQKIVANPGTLTGSIGVISQLPYLGGIAEQLHFKMITIKSGKLKDVGNSFREMTDEERAYFQGMMDSVHNQFIAAVVQGRGLKDEEVRPYADGRILTGAQAKDLKFVDELGNFNDAIKLTAALAGIEGDPKLVYPSEEQKFGIGELFKEGGSAMMRGMKEEALGTASGASMGLTTSSPGLMYLMPFPGGGTAQ